MTVKNPFVVLMLAALVYVLPAQAQQPPKINRADVRPTDAGSGVEMFKEYCAVCHGMSGKGDGPAATALKKAPADLTQLSRRNGGNFPAVQVSFTIEGRDIVASHGSRDMPIWGNIFGLMDGDKIAKLRIHNLTEHVRSLQK